jgi:hypothetical protein
MTMIEFVAGLPKDNLDQLAGLEITEITGDKVDLAIEAVRAVRAAQEALQRPKVGRPRGSRSKAKEQGNGQG